MRVVEMSADATLAQRLESEIGDPVILFERLSLADEIPISLSSSHFPGERMPGLMTHCQTYYSISAMLQQEYGFDHIRRSTRLSARLARPRDARLLRMPATNPILLSESININQTGDVIEYGVTRFRGDRMELVIDNET
jgi:GntR family phosphonate transport system transcriptional regulator